MGESTAPQDDKDQDKKAKLKAFFFRKKKGTKSNKPLNHAKNLLKIRFVLSNDALNPIEKSSKNRHGNSHRICHHGIHRIFRQIDSHSHQQYYCPIAAVILESGVVWW